MIRKWQLFLLASVPLSLVLSIAGCSPSGSSEDASASEYQRVTTSAQAQLPLFPLGGDIMMPFPRQPELITSLNQGEAQVFHYSWGQEGQPLAYSAMTMAGPAFSEGVDIDRLLQALGENMLEGMRAAGAVVSVTRNDPIKVAAMQGRVVVADLTTRDGAFRSHTINLYHDRRVFQWAIQDSPAVSGSLAADIFFRELDQIRMAGGGTPERPQAIEAGLSVERLDGRISAPMSSNPERSVQSQPFGEVTMWVGEPNEHGFNATFFRMSGLPRVADPPATILRGMTGEGVEILNGTMTLFGRTARWSLYEVQAGRGMVRFFSVAFVHGEDVYVWSVSTDERRLFREIESVGKAEAQRISFSR